jgi:hypothetical protein
MRIARVIATTAACLAAVSTSLTAPAFAGGKAAVGCANGDWQLAYYVTSVNLPSAPTTPVLAVIGDLVNVGGADPGAVELRTHTGLTDGTFAREDLDVPAILGAVDKNGDGDICYKLPNGWTEGTSKQTDLLSLTDNKSTT